MAKFTLQQFTAFLESVDLEQYRKRFSQIKTVEMDLPRNIQALKTIYEQYWQNKDDINEPLAFDKYYDVYWHTHEKDITDFWNKTGFGRNCDCFQKGLEARIYRTWASLITQIHAGYVAESVFGKGSVRMGTELDHKNVDILIVNPMDNSEKLKIQIKKETHRPEIARMQKNVISDNGVVDIYYIVPKASDYENPFYIIPARRGELRNSLKEFLEFGNPNGTLTRLKNGFVIFTKNAFIGLL